MENYTATIVEEVIEASIVEDVFSVTVTGGLQGAQGDQGIQGIQGEQGIQGIQGEQGIQGIQGEQGIQGDTGATGADGTVGLPTVSYHTLTTGQSVMVHTGVLQYTSVYMNGFRLSSSDWVETLPSTVTLVVPIQTIADAELSIETFN